MRQTRYVTAFLFALFLWQPFLAAATAPDKVPVYSLVRVKLDEGERATVFAEKLTPVEVVRSFEGIVFTGPAGRYAVLVISTEDIKTLFVEITSDAPPGPSPPPIPPNPGPGPGPSPPGPTPPGPVIPAGFAGEVYQKALSVGDKPNCEKIATNYRNVHAAIAAGGIKTPAEAKTQIFTLNKALSLPQTWLGFGQWLGAEANKRAPNTSGMDAARQLFDDVATGLEAASK